ncbi:MAG: DUF1302 family protein [Pseudomonadota bacterium]
MKIRKTAPTALQGMSAIALLVSSQAALSADWDMTGFIRQEGAYALSDGGRENYWNQSGNIYNGRPTVNSLGNTITRPASFEEDNDWNLNMTRVQFDIDVRFNPSLKWVTKVRGLYAWDTYDSSVGDPNYFEVPFRDDCGTRLEICGDDYMVDLPSFYLDYNEGGWWIRAGQQQIAWGESYFFRVLDTPNGLDLRRHSVLDWAAEEFSDKRVPALGVRASYQFDNGWELEGWAQEFQPTIYSDENTPYNVIASQFVVVQEEGFNEVDDEWNFGGRFRGQVGDLGLQFTYTNRRNPDGVFRWTASNVDPFVKNGILDPNGLGPLLAQTPFEPFTGQGVYTSNEWYNYAGRSRLNGIDVQQLLDDFPVAQALTDPVLAALGFPAGTQVNTFGVTELVLDAFFDASAGGLGDLRGYIDRRYKREDILGFGANYIFFSTPDSLLDQLIVRFEMTYTPDKVFTAPNLAADYVESDEWVTALVFEKYHRFSEAFPATYMVLQWLHKTESDLAGRYLDGYGGQVTYAPDATGPGGRNGFDAISFAFQQPSPTLAWRTDFAILWDPKGGYLIQPGVRWKPDTAWTAELFANFIGGDNGDNENTLSTFSYANEVALRLTYQF